MSLMTTKQDSEANGSSQQAAQEWARQAGQYLRARQLAAQAQLAPLATSARIAAAQRLLGARAWSAPRLDSMSHALQEQWAPRISAAMADYARRIEPVPEKPPRRRWPTVAGIVVIAAGSAVAVVFLSRRFYRQQAEAGEAGEPGEPGEAGEAGEAASSPDAAREMAPADAVGADVNGQSQSP